MVISLSPVKRKKGCIWVKYLIYAILSRFQIGHHLSVFSAKSVISQIQSSQRNLFFLRLMTHDTFCQFQFYSFSFFCLQCCHQQFILGQLKLPRDSKTKITLKYAAKKDFSIKKEFWLFLLFFVNFSIYGQGHQHCLQSDRLVKSFRLYRRYHGP